MHNDNVQYIECTIEECSKHLILRHSLFHFSCDVLEKTKIKYPKHMSGIMIKSLPNNYVKEKIILYMLKGRELQEERKCNQIFKSKFFSFFLVVFVAIAIASTVHLLCALELNFSVFHLYFF